VIHYFLDGVAATPPPGPSWLLHAALSYIRGVRGVGVHFQYCLLLGTKVLSDKSTELLVLSLKNLTSNTDIIIIIIIIILQAMQIHGAELIIGS
jgi:hypothetical protein